MSLETSSRILRTVSPGGVLPAVWSEFTREYQALSPDETRSSNMCVRAGATMSTKRQGYQAKTEATEPQPTQQQLFRQLGSPIEGVDRVGGGRRDPDLGGSHGQHRHHGWPPLQHQQHQHQQPQQHHQQPPHHQNGNNDDTSAAAVAATAAAAAAAAAGGGLDNPRLKRNKPVKWSAEEDRRLRDAVVRFSEARWKDIASLVQTRNHVQCLQRWKKVLKPGLVKGQWSAEEDDRLVGLVEKGFRNWGQVASFMDGRTSKQCRERWCHHLDPAVRKGGYTTEEDELIIFLQGEVGNRWADIAKRLTGRTENAVKIRWKALNRRQRDARNKAAAAAASPAAPTGHRLLPRPAAGASNGPLSSSSSSSDAGGRGAVDERETVRGGMMVGPGGGGGGGKTFARASSTSSSSSSSSSSAAAANGGGGSSSSEAASRRQKGGGGGARAAMDTPAAASGVAGPGGMSMRYSSLPPSSSLANIKPNLTPAEAGDIHAGHARRSLSYPAAFAAASAATSSSPGYPINDAAAGAAATCASLGRIDRPPGVGVGAGFQQESGQAVAGSCCGGGREGGEGKSGRQQWSQKVVGGEASSFDDRAPLTGSGLVAAAAAAASAGTGSGMVPSVKGVAAPEGARASPSRRYPFASGDGGGGGGGGDERPAGSGGKMECAGAGDGGLHRLCAALANVEAMDNMHKRGSGAVAAAAARTASSSRASPRRAELEGGGGGGKRSGRSTPSGEEEGQQQQQVGGKSPGAAAAAASRTKRARDDGVEVGKAQASAGGAAAAEEGGGSPSKVASDPPPAKRPARSPANTDAAVPTSYSPPAAAAAAAASSAAAPGAAAVAGSLASHD
ncbi:MYB [Ectocarpus sp. CCAP 1310/34]|nr:MYB [Ectocarpus sp. CCAP 1310/34]